MQGYELRVEGVSYEARIQDAGLSVKSYELRVKS